MLNLPGNLYCEQSEHEGEAPTALLSEGATRAPLIVSLRKGLSKSRRIFQYENTVQTV
jgi:hypothetical protein